MKKRAGDSLGQFVGDADAATVVATNGDIDKAYRAHMRSGSARKAAEVWGEFPRMLGKLIDTCGNHVFVVPITRQKREWTVSFPIRHLAKDKPDPELMERSARELVALADAYKWTHVFMPPELIDLPSKDRAMLNKILDGRFIVVYDPEQKKREQKEAEQKRKRLKTAKPKFKKVARR